MKGKACVYDMERRKILHGRKKRIWMEGNCIARSQQTIDRSIWCSDPKEDFFFYGRYWNRKEALWIAIANFENRKRDTEAIYRFGHLCVFVCKLIRWYGICCDRKASVACVRCICIVRLSVGWLVCLAVFWMNGEVLDRGCTLPWTVTFSVYYSLRIWKILPCPCCLMEHSYLSLVSYYQSFLFFWLYCATISYLVGWLGRPRSLSHGGAWKEDCVVWSAPQVRFANLM